MSLSRFKASLVGAAIADCMGASFEGISRIPMANVLESATNLEQNHKLQGLRPADMYGLSFTDDTAMARSVANSLIAIKGFDATHMAKRFTEEFFKEPNRGYGGGVITVFEELRKTDFKDAFAPAKAQFDGSGSYGNGGAMRIAPAALFAHAMEKTTEELLALVSPITRLTHTNRRAVDGAILLSSAVAQCLKLCSENDLEYSVFLDSLMKLMKPIEELEISDETEPSCKKSKRELDCNPTPYTAKLEKINEFLGKDVVETSQIVENLGHDISALGSVPTAIFAFLRAATKGIPELHDRNKFEQTVLYAISLGGDTDTIATMAAAMAGAVYGMEMIPESWQYYCEGVADAETMAEKLFTINE